MNKKTINTKVMGDIFDGILNQSQEEALKNFPELHKSFENILDKNIETLNYEVFYQIDSAIRSSIANKMDKKPYDKSVSALVFLYTNYHFVEGHLRYFIETKEGMGCCADKSRWLIQAIKKFYFEGTPIDMTIEEKCYWKPHFWSGEDWLELFDCIQDLYFHFSNKYMLFLQKNWVPLLQQPQGDK